MPTRWPNRRLIVAALFLCTWSARGRTFPIREFNIGNGLPHNRINRIYRDSSDFLWIGTDDGLVRFDGRQFTTYSTADGLPHVHVNAIVQTRSGQYWIATDGGIARFDPQPGARRFTAYVPANSPGAREVNTVVEDADGSLLLGTNAGLYRFRFEQAGQFIAVDYHPSHENPGSLKVNAIATDAGRLWVGTEYGLYGRGLSGAWAQYGRAEGLPSPAFIFALARDPHGRLWAGFRGGFGRLSQNPQPNQPILDLARTAASDNGFIDARAMLIGPDSSFRIATESGLVEWVDYAASGCRFRRYTVAEGFKEEETHDLAMDSSGNLWIGTRRSGITCIGRTDFKTYARSEGLTPGDNPTLVETHDGNVCVFDITPKRRLNCFDRAHDAFRAFDFAIPSRFDGVDPHWLETARPDRQRGWWLSTMRGMFYTPAVEAVPTRNFGPRVTRFFQDPASGDLWMVVMFKDVNDRHGLLHWSSPDRRLHDETPMLPAEAVSRGIASFAQASNGDLWLGLERPGGLLRKRGDRYELVSNGPAGHIAQLFVDSRKRLWIASTEAGLGRVDDPGATHPGIHTYTRSDGLLSSEVWSVAEDRYGRIYAGCSRGLDRLEPEIGRVVHFTSEDGLVTGDIRGALRARDGDLWFASSHGVSHYEPQPDEKRTPADTRITGVRVAGVPLPLSELGSESVGPLRLRAGENSLEIDYGGTGFRFAGTTMYEIRSNPNGAWQDSRGNTSLNLLNLAPGDYEIGIRAVSSDGARGRPASLAVTVQPQVWATWWFRLLLASLACGVLYAIHALRLSKRLALERIRTDLAMDLHDDVGASLSRIYMMGQAVRSRSRAADGAPDRMVDEIVDSSRRLLTEMNDIVWSLNPQRDSFPDLVSRIRAFGSGILENLGIEWVVETEGLPSHLRPDMRRQIYLLFKEGINNVAKHSGAQRATLRFWRDDHALYGELADDGRGLPAEDSDAGNGIASMRARAAGLGGSLAIECGGGTRVTLRLPVQKHVRALAKRSHLW